MDSAQRISAPTTDSRTLEVDVLVIGWGKGGKTLARSLGSSGTRVALVEQSESMIGGTCINVACVPTKTLIHQAAMRPEDAAPADWFTTSVEARDALIGKLNARNRELVEEAPDAVIVMGTAAFVDPHTVEVTQGEDRMRIVAGTIVVNTGTVPASPPIPGADSARVYDSTTLQHADPFPERLVIVGGGYIGLEFAGMFAGFGAEVTVVDPGERILPREDEDVAAGVAEHLGSAGVTFRLGSGVSAIEETADGVDVRTEDGGTVAADAVLLAVGRSATTADLGLDRAGIEVDDRGFIRVDDTLRSVSADHVFAVGDINGGPQFTYVSLDDNRIVADQLSGSGERRRSDRVAVPNTMFLTPPLSRVGINEQQAREEGRRVLVAAKPVAAIAAMPRPKILGNPTGMIKVVADPDTRELLGATVWCVDSQEVINLLALAMRAGVTVDALRDGIWTHPSSTEALNEVLGELAPLAD